MALTLTELNAVTKDYCNNKSTDIYFSDNVLLWKLMSKGKMNANLVTPNEIVDNGENIRVVLEYAASNTGSYGKNTIITQQKVAVLNAARFRWAGYYASNAIDLDDKIANNGDAAYVNLIKTKLGNIEKTVRDKMGTDIYASAANSNSFLGLGNLFNTTTSTTYGGIAEDDMAKWAAKADATGGSITFAVLQAMRRGASVGQTNAGKPNLYITTELLKDAFENTLQLQARYSDSDLAVAGFSNIMFSSYAPVVADDKQTAGYCDALNLNFLSIKTHKDFAFTKPVWEHDKEQPDTEVANIRWVGQLVTSNRRAHYRKTGLTA